MTRSKNQPGPDDSPTCATHSIQRGIREAQQTLVPPGQHILWHYKIDTIYGIENLVWAPNIKGQHTKEALDIVLQKLIQLKNKGATREEVVDALRNLGEIAANRTIL